ncbi:MAG: protein translocase subunit SecF [Bryobacteraceae bacterium]
MELFVNTRFDFLGRKWWFILPTLILLLAGAVSLAVKGGPRYGIEFQGGAVMDVRWQGTPPVEAIRSAAAARLSGVNVVAAHDLSGSNGVLVSVEVPADADLTPLRSTIIQALNTVSTTYTVRSFEVIGPQIGADLRHQALLAAAGASTGMLAYLAWRFRLAYAAAAVLAMIHDAFITVGLFSLLNMEISLTVVAALLTLVGYSMNDTIVVFDRVRENRLTNKRESLSAVINRSINETLGRTVLTSGLTLLTALALLAFGGPVLHGFAFALTVGIIAGTLSTVFVAGPILVAWEERFAEVPQPRAALPVGGVQ